MDWIKFLIGFISFTAFFIACAYGVTMLFYANLALGALGFAGLVAIGCAGVLYAADADVF